MRRTRDPSHKQSRVKLSEVCWGAAMARVVGPILKTFLFTIVVPGTVIVYIPMQLLGGYYKPGPGPLTWIGGLCVVLGAAIYFRCAWEFAVRGLGTPAPIAPTKYLVTTALHRYVRNPMYIGVFLVLVGQIVAYGSLKLLGYAAFFCIAVELFVVFYEEPTLRRQFGDTYEGYRRRVPRWIPRIQR